MPAPTFRSTVAEFAGFLRRPQLLSPQGLRAPGNIRVWLQATVLMVVTLFAVILPLLRLWQHAFDLADPVAFEQVPQSWLVPIVVVIAPLSEELLFRGWQTGSRRALALLGCALLALVGLVLAVMPGREGIALGLIGAALVTALAAGVMLRRNRAPLGWFARGFPVIFYLAAALFALVHLANYGQVSAAAVPLVLPQLWAALVLGFVRQRIGLVGSILAHATSNGAVMGLALAVSST